jgi:homoserine kinase
MRKVKVILPAAVTNLGPGLNSLGLALSLHMTVDVTERSDQSLVIEGGGEGASQYKDSLRHPVMLGAIRVFQKMERAPLGMTIHVGNEIPLNSGLGAETGFVVAGVIAANNLLGNPFKREQTLQIAAEAAQSADGVVTTMLGGLTASLMRPDGLIYRSLAVQAMKVAVVLPGISGYAEKIQGILPKKVTFSDAMVNLNHLPLMIEAFREGNLKLLEQVMDDRLAAPVYRPLITGYEGVVEAARREGARAVIFSGNGPALVAFAATGHQAVAEAMVAAFDSGGVKARSWVLTVDTQGVVVSVAQSG